MPKITPAIPALAVSNGFVRVRPDQPVSLSGSGIILYPHLDPQGMLALRLVVVESDATSRDLGRTLAKNRDDILFAHNHSAFDFNHHGLATGATRADFAIGNDRAPCMLRMRASA